MCVIQQDSPPYEHLEKNASTVLSFQAKFSWKLNNLYQCVSKKKQGPVRQ